MAPALRTPCDALNVTGVVVDALRHRGRLRDRHDYPDRHQQGRAEHPLQELNCAGSCRRRDGRERNSDGQDRHLPQLLPERREHRRDHDPDHRGHWDHGWDHWDHGSVRPVRGRRAPALYGDPAEAESDGR